LSRQWLILLDGAIAVALVSGEADAALDARAAAQALLDTESASASDPLAGRSASGSPGKAPGKRPPSRRTAT
jgi:hypothetical protein